MSDGYDDLPHLFEKHGFHDRASALRRLISERDALLEEAVGFRQQETQKAEEQVRDELEEVQAAYATVANIRGEAKTALQKYGNHLSDCRSITHRAKKPEDGWGPWGPPNVPPCDCGFDRLLQGGL